MEVYWLQRYYAAKSLKVKRTYLDMYLKAYFHRLKYFRE